MSPILRNLFRYNAIPLVGFWFLGPLAVLVARIASDVPPTGYVDILRLPLLLPTTYVLFVVALMAAVIHLPVHVAHGISRRRFLAAAAVFLAVVSASFALLTSAGNLAYDRYFVEPALTGGDLGHSFVARLAMNLAYMVAGWLVGLAYYRFHPWIATALLPFAVAPVIAAEAATNQVWSQKGYMYTIGNYQGRFGFWVDFALVGAAIVAGALAAGVAGDRVPLRAKRA